MNKDLAAALQAVTDTALAHGWRLNQIHIVIKQESSGIWDNPLLPLVLLEVVMIVALALTKSKKGGIK